MKQNVIDVLGSIFTVAPYVGAWIETNLDMESSERDGVAPYVGAWIETSFVVANYVEYVVAPYVGAWIETRS